MDVDEVKQLEEHLVYPFLPLLDIFVDELRDLLAGFVDAVACCPYDEGKGYQLAGKWETIGAAVEPFREARAVLGGLQDGA